MNECRFSRRSTRARPSPRLSGANLLRRDARMFVLGAKYHPLRTEPIAPVTGLKLFVMMGRDLRAVDEVPAGNVVAIGGLQAHVLRFATLCSTRSCVSLAHISMQVIVL